MRGEGQSHLPAFLVRFRAKHQTPPKEERFLMDEAQQPPSQSLDPSSEVESPSRTSSRRLTLRNFVPRRFRNPPFPPSGILPFHQLRNKEQETLRQETKVRAFN